MRTNAQIYVVLADDGLVKVGLSTRVHNRMKELGNPGTIAHLTEVKEQAEAIERTAHRILRLAGKWVTREWFSATVAEAVQAIGRAERMVLGAEFKLDTPRTDYITLNFRLTYEMRDKLDDLRCIESEIPTRADMMRLLLLRAHEIMQQEGKTRERKTAAQERRG